MTNDSGVLFPANGYTLLNKDKIDPGKFGMKVVHNKTMISGLKLKFSLHG